MAQMVSQGHGKPGNTQLEDPTAAAAVPLVVRSKQHY
jgi:hypothetical protein